MKRQMPKETVEHTQAERAWLMRERARGRSAPEARARWAAERRAWQKRMRRKDGRPRAAANSKLEERTPEVAMAISKLEERKTEELKCSQLEERKTGGHGQQ